MGVWSPDGSAPTTALFPTHCGLLRLSGTEAEALGKFGQTDIIHDNGIWLQHNHRLARLAAMLGIPRIISPRGMLEPWALAQKRWKKQIAWRLYQRRDLMRADFLHATAPVEAANIRQLAPCKTIRVIPNGVDLPESGLGLDIPHEDLAGTRKTALFLSRIHPKKGLPMLIAAWAQVRPAGWSLRIVGPDEGGHRVQVEDAVRAAALKDAVSFAGPLTGTKKREAFFGANLFILPSHSENFGLVVIEALAHGLPVLTTTGAPWSELPQRGCGWWVNPTVDGLAEGLRTATSCDRGILRQMGCKGREWVTKEFAWKRVAHEFISAYEELLAGRSPQAKQAA